MCRASATRSLLTPCISACTTEAAHGAEPAQCEAMDETHVSLRELDAALSYAFTTACEPVVGCSAMSA